ncbi:insulin degrading enzyme-like protein [Dinothrombium tinctorium]|uniref:Insulin degrading enzyme-like protein n=1 Tax=Dinothrombium tinctorium TaxID=1965070 RepID=A0A3S4R4R0_9ACAR|nr:insulin degrading enzyme-like protein [Dinothrombium tinctorium]
MIGTAFDECLTKDANSGIFKSVSDKKNYKRIQLQNGFHALLVSDTNRSQEVNKLFPSKKSFIENQYTKKLSSLNEHVSSDEDSISESDSESDVDSECGTDEKLAAACLYVNVGSFNDPDTVPGLAHLLEHVITMGSEEYPQENAFDMFLNNNGGYSNACTSYEYTLFEFEIPNEFFKQSLQMFASYFIAPLLKETSIEKEIKPVDTEFVESSSDQPSRMEMFFTAFAKDGHPLKKFSWGNKKTLQDIPAKKGINIRGKLIEFYNKYYVAENMVLVVQAEESLQTLESWVTQIFKDIPQKNLNFDEKNIKSSPFSEKFFKYYIVKPIEQTNKLIITWWLPSMRKHYKINPISHIGGLIGHEGKGSLLSFLRRKGLAIELESGNSGDDFEENKYQSLFTITIDLTDEGLNKLDEVVKYVFAFIELLRKNGPQKYFFEEESQTAFNSFRFREEISSSDSTKKLALRYFHYPIEDILAVNLFYIYDEKVIRNCLQLLTSKKANFTLLSGLAFEKSSKPVQKEHWMKTEYKTEVIPDRWVQDFDPSLVFNGEVQFPESNPFIATDFTILKMDKTSNNYPLAIIQNEDCMLWYKKDETFLSPKATILFCLTPTAIELTIRHHICLDLFVEILKQVLKDDVYPAYCADLGYSVTVMSNSKLHFKFYGFNHKLPNLVNLVMKRAVNCSFDKQMFENIKTDLSRNYYNHFISSKELSESLRMSILKPKYFTSLEKFKEIATITQEDVLETVKLFFRSVYNECLIQGNISETEAVTIVNNVVSLFKGGHYSSTRDLLINELPKGESVLRVKTFNPEERHSVLINYYQIGSLDIKTNCLIELLSVAMEEPLFDTLRTQQGLGYEVSNSPLDTNGIGGLKITVVYETKKYDCDFIDEKVENFIKQFGQKIEQMSKEQFANLVRSRIKCKSVPDLSLMEEVSRNWNEIVSQNHCFDRLKKEVTCLETISLSEFQRWSLHQMLQFPSRRKLSIQIVGNEAGEAKETLSNYNLQFTGYNSKQYFIRNVDAFKKTLKTFPVTFVRQ